MNKVGFGIRGSGLGVAHLRSRTDPHKRRTRARGPRARSEKEITLDAGVGFDFAGDVAVHIVFSFSRIINLQI